MKKTPVNRVIYTIYCLHSLKRHALNVKNHRRQLYDTKGA